MVCQKWVIRQALSGEKKEYAKIVVRLLAKTMFMVTVFTVAKTWRVGLKAERSSLNLFLKLGLLFIKTVLGA